MIIRRAGAACSWSLSLRRIRSTGNRYGRGGKQNECGFRIDQMLENQAPPRTASGWAELERSCDKELYRQTTLSECAEFACDLCNSLKELFKISNPMIQSTRMNNGKSQFL